MENPKSLPLCGLWTYDLTKHTMEQIKQCQIRSIEYVVAKCKNAHSYVCKNGRQRSKSMNYLWKYFDLWTYLPGLIWLSFLLTERVHHPFHPWAHSSLINTTLKNLRRTINASIAMQTARGLLFAHNSYCTCHYCIVSYYQSDQLKINSFQIGIHF